MGYSKSKKVVRQFESYLIQLTNAKSTILFPNKNPSRLGYKIREAIFASQFFEDTRLYANLQSKFLFRIKNNGISCEIRDQIEFDSTLIKEEMKQEIVINDVTTIPGVIGAVIKHKGYVMIFPDFSSENELTPLNMFCERLGYSYTLDPLTITKENDST